jgi:Uma2 family endonuclease
MPDDGHRYELVNGSLVVCPRPSAVHQATAARMAGALLSACPKDMFVLSGQTVRLNHMTVFAPDIVVTRHLEPGRGQQTESPHLVVEVHPPAAAPIDLAHRMAAYAALGVRSYWIVVPDTRQPEIIAFDAADGHYEQTATVKGNEPFQTRQPFPLEISPARLGRWARTDNATRIRLTRRPAGPVRP